MPRREFFRRGLILAITSTTALMAHATDPRFSPHPVPGIPAWNYHNLPGGPQVVPGVGRGAYVGPGAFRAGWWPGQQSVIGSTWTNGLSRYGPPIPTYTPTTGTFGNADISRLFPYQPPPPFFGFGPVVGLGWASRMSPSPRPLPTVSVYPQAPMRASSVVVQPSTEAPHCIRVMVTMPHETADLWVEKQVIASKGVERIFESPALELGQRYSYQIMARWVVDGKEVAESRTVTAQAGDLVRVNFTIPAE
jgi:uncharacterized protein (TIGR03000 family)